MRRFQRFTWKDGNYRICSDQLELVKEEIIQQRYLLEKYIEIQPELKTSLSPLTLTSAAPEIARKMAAAADITGLGPMASVAGAIAQEACEQAVLNGAREAVIENGGDIYLISNEEIIVGLYTGENPLGSKLAFKVPASMMPLAICSSSSRMGHSLSFGDCDLACVVARSAALADSAATLACNSVTSPDHIEMVTHMIMEIPGIMGVLIVEGGKIGLAGELPELIRNNDPLANSKITKDVAYFHA